MSMKIAVAGTGYVGMSAAVLLAQYNRVVAVDVRQDRVDMINLGMPTIKDDYASELLGRGELSLTATTDGASAYADAEFVVIAVPTNYDPKRGYFDTSHIEDVVRLVLSVNPEAVMVIKSTIPIGYTERLRAMYESAGKRKPRIIFSPEFLREGSAIHDNLYPSRIIVGYDKSDAGLAKSAAEFANLLFDGAWSEDAPVLLMGSTEAEAVKLFANTYLALRVSYFNELDTFAEINGLDSRSIIDGVSADPRIRDGYNNPSFGYGGYCFPKDTRQLLADFYASGTPQSTIRAAIDANTKRKEHIVDMVNARLGDLPGGTVGIYRLAMKSGSDNFRESAVWDIMDSLSRFHSVIVYEPSVTDRLEINGYELVSSLPDFKKRSSVIVANRLSEELRDVEQIVYTRDLYNNN